MLVPQLKLFEHRYLKIWWKAKKCLYQHSKCLCIIIIK
jgi:hypothetical protein